MTQDTQTLDPRWVARVTGGEAGPEAGEASDLVWDSRAVTPGAAFVALPGARTHGNRFLDDATARGATLLLTDRPHPKAVRVADPYRALLALGGALRKRFPGPVVGITGSVGKTSTKAAIAQGLDLAAPPGNLNTPPALARFFLRLDPKAPGAAVELGIDRPGEMAELLALAAPEIGVLTAVAPAHLSALETEAAIAREKGRLLRSAETALVEVKTARRWGLPGRTYGFDPAADFAASDLALTEAGTRFTYRGHRVALPYLGEGVALAALAALALAEVLGRPLAEVADRLAGLKLPPGRMQLLRRGPYRVVHDAYNANPASVAAGLRAIAALPGRKVVVLGEMKELGAAAERHHREAARTAAGVADALVFVGAYARAMAEAAGRGLAVQDLAGAEAALADLLRPGDLVYLKASRAVGLERLLEVLDA